MTNSTLEQIFSASDEDVETFSDIAKSMHKELGDQEVVQLKKTSSFVTQEKDLIEIKHGHHENSYVWHIRPAHPRRPWAVPMPRVIYAIGAVLNRHLPDALIIDLHLPNKEWEIEEITVRANGALDHWCVDADLIAEVTAELFEVTGALI